MNTDYDVIVLGAGPAGCSAAYDLLASGLRVLLLETSVFPRHKACACGLTHKTLRALRYSVEPVLQRNVSEAAFQEAGRAFQQGARACIPAMTTRVSGKRPFCAMAVREDFDAFCLGKTLAFGRGLATLHHIRRVHTLREFDGHIELGIEDRAGTHRVFLANVLVGADGANGQSRRFAHALTQTEKVTGADVARTADASCSVAEPPWFLKAFALEACVPYNSLPEKLPTQLAPTDFVLDFAPIYGGYGWLFPKRDHVNIGIGTFLQAPDWEGQDRVVRTDLDAPTRRALRHYMQFKCGLTEDKSSQFAVTGQHLGLGGHAYVPSGSVLLVGDAAGLVDPLTGEGIYAAIRSGQAAAAAIAEVLRSNPSLRTRPREEASRAGDAANAGAQAPFAVAYATRLRSLQRTFELSFRAARLFYTDPSLGVKLMRVPVLNALIVRSYTRGWLSAGGAISWLYWKILSVLFDGYLRVRGSGKQNIMVGDETT